MVFQQPRHGFVPGELVVSVLGRVASSSPAVLYDAVISSAGGIPVLSQIGDTKLNKFGNTK